MGDETKGVLRLIRLVTGVSRATSEAAKPGMRGQYASPRPWLLDSTNVARKHQEIIICQAAVDLRVQQCFRVKTVSSRVLMVEDLERFCVVQDLLFRHQLRAAIARIPIGEGHGGVNVF